jgi:N-acetylmuramoyl-L-alanine amidase
VRVIRHGDRSDAVADLQARLGRLGFEVAPAELGGTFGATTRAAVRAFQQRRGIDVDGIVGPVTWRELVESSWSLGDRLLHLRQPSLRGDDVRQLQSCLNALGFAAGKHDGIFGPQTASALRDFQCNLAIDEDGMAGLETIRAMKRLRMVIKSGLGPRIREREARRASPPGLPGKRIAVDPGHGGADPGNLGPSGETEAELTFRLAARLAQILEAEGALTTLTRGPNDGPGHTRRAQVANQFDAHAFISIHLNGHSTELAQGAATYYFEHSGIASEPGEHLAGLLLDSLVGLGLIDCRAHGKAYPILRETRMPAVVVEPCFITNPEEAKLLQDAERLDAVAVAMGGAVKAYFSDLHS